MVSDEVFYTKFRDWIVGSDEVGEEVMRPGQQVENKGHQEDEDGGGNGVGNDEENKDGGFGNGENDHKSNRISFLLHQLEIVPTDVRKMYSKMMRA